MFRDRNEAGLKLAEKLIKYRDDSNSIVFGIPRGGVVVAGEICKELNLPLDIVVTRKVGAPFNDELVYVISQEPFYAVGQFYKGFFQVSDEEVIKILRKYKG